MILILFKNSASISIIYLGKIGLSITTCSTPHHLWISSYCSMLPAVDAFHAAFSCGLVVTDNDSFIISIFTHPSHAQFYHAMHSFTLYDALTFLVPSPTPLPSPQAHTQDTHPCPFSSLTYSPEERLTHISSFPILLSPPLPIHLLRLLTRGGTHSYLLFPHPTHSLPLPIHPPRLLTRGRTHSYLLFPHPTHHPLARPVTAAYSRHMHCSCHSLTHPLVRNILTYSFIRGLNSFAGASGRMPLSPHPRPFAGHILSSFLNWCGI